MYEPCMGSTQPAVFLICIITNILILLQVELLVKVVVVTYIKGFYSSLPVSGIGQVEPVGDGVGQ